MKIRLDKKIIEGDRSRANFHLEESESGLCLYLPKDEVDRVVCFECQLPQRLRKFLNITDPAAEGVLGGVFRQQNPAVIERILDHAGVPPMSFSDYPETEDGLPNEQQMVEYLSSVRAQGQTTPSRGSRNSPAPATPNQTPSLLMPTSGQLRPSLSEDQELSYRKILDNVITIARRRAADNMFSGIGSRDNLFSVLNVLPPEVIKQGFGYRSIDRDRRVGAAGELYVRDIFP